MTPETRLKISKSLKGSVKLSEAIKRVHSKRLANGEDAKMRDKIKATRIAKGDWKPHDKTEWTLFRKQVRVITSHQPIHLLPNYDKRGRGPGKYHLDHIVSQKAGFDLGFTPWFIGHIDNLQMLPESENCSKQQWTTDDEILNLWYSTTETFEI
jgi:hypothetical protein